MNKKGRIIVIEDDEDDRIILELAFKELDYINEILFFSTAKSALEFLKKSDSHPFIILSDINLPILNGFDLRKKLNEDADLGLRCIPYIFFTTAANKKAVIDAYSLSVQGFFTKPTTFNEIKELLQCIMTYWTKCSAPNSFA